MVHKCKVSKNEIFCHYFFTILCSITETFQDSRTLNQLKLHSQKYRQSMTHDDSCTLRYSSLPFPYQNFNAKNSFISLRFTILNLKFIVMLLRNEIRFYYNYLYYPDEFFE